MDKKEISPGLKYCFAMPLFLALLYFISIADLEYGFYTFVRIVSLVCLAIFIFAYTKDTEFLNFPNIASLIILILFNPIHPIYFDKETWVVFDIISGVVMVAISIYIHYKNIWTPAAESKSNTDMITKD